VRAWKCRFMSRTTPLAGTAPASTIALSTATLFATLALLATPAAAEVVNPCETPEARQLLCPNLKIGRPADIYLDRGGGRALLRATSDVKSRGKGPMELRGHRDGWHSMRVNQRIHRVGSGRLFLPTEAELHFTDVGAYFGGSYWRVHQLAGFTLRRVGPRTARPARSSAPAPSSTTACAISSAPAPATARHLPATTPAATRTPMSTRSPSAPRSAGRTSTRPTTTSSGSTSAACAAASPTR